MKAHIRTGLRWLLGLGLVIQGANHFVNVEFFRRMMPDYLPAPTMLVLLSGAAEVVLGFLCLSRRTQRLAGWGILALLVCVFPANLQMALHPEQWPGIPAAALWARLPFQLVFAAWAYWTCLGRPAAP